MFRVTTDADAEQARLKLEGKLCGPWVEEFRRCWDLTKEVYPGHLLVVDLSGLTFIGVPGKELLRSISREGARLEGAGLFARALVEEVRTNPKESGGKPMNAGTGILRSLALLILAGFAGLSTARAQEKPVLRLTLGDGVQLALKQNPRVQMANLSAAQSDQDRVIARPAAAGWY
ncbi:MAG: hypothetical protein HY508_15155 [Acidobacteria bacterium]|nr:hypothetical protein [Acidobacteriota bacterium]